MSESRIIVALDGKSQEEIMDLVEKLKCVVGGFKFNDALDIKAEEILRPIRIGTGGQAIIMADPKLHDIPNTVGNRAKNFEAMQASWITVHASGGVAMMRAAVEKVDNSKILAVTVLTSHTNQDCHLTYGVPSMEGVLRFARWAALAEVWGIVCSPKELEFLSKYPELANLVRVTPGIRPAGADIDDQKRIATPGGAILAGADYLVIGRPITKAEDPVAAAEAINQEVAAALKELEEKEGGE
jgi:orotidine-5'-phosphate decarboxylase